MPCCSGVGHDGYRLRSMENYDHRCLCIIVGGSGLTMGRKQLLGGRNDA